MSYLGQPPPLIAAAVHGGAFVSGDTAGGSVGCCGDGRVCSTYHFAEEVRQLRLETGKMREELRRVKEELSSLKQRRKVQVLTQLNAPLAKQPACVFSAWIAALPLTAAHLRVVQESDLTQGMVAVLRDHVRSCAAEALPVCAFVQKPSTVFGFVEDACGMRCWKAMSPRELSDIFDRLKHRFLQRFLEWQKSQLSIIAAAASEDDSDDDDDEAAAAADVDRMLEMHAKILDSGGRGYARTRFIEKWLHDSLRREFVVVEKRNVVLD